MILRKITLTNFGIYAGQITFDLSPVVVEQFNRPIVLFRGKNGVGKSTLVEAIRFCLHGPLVLGDRVGQREYETYLQQKLHRASDGSFQTYSGAVTLVFDYVTIGRRKTYIVSRIWQQERQGISNDVLIWEDEIPINTLLDEKDQLLRELVPPGVANLFFFDGERIATLAETGAEADSLLAETVKNLLGLHLIDQLDRDLDVYLTRQSGVRELHGYQMELDALRSDEAELRQQLNEIQSQLIHCRQRLSQQRKMITAQEQMVAQEGGNFSRKQKKQESNRQQLAAAIQAQKQIVYELSRELLPFAVAPKLLKAVRQRLKDEAVYEQWQATQTVLTDIQQEIVEATAPSDYWANAERQHAFLLQIRERLAQYAAAPIAQSEVVHRVSIDTRDQLLDWIDQALTQTPHQLAEAVQQLQLLQVEQEAVEQDLKRVPLDQIIMPLQDELRRLERDLGRLEAEQERLQAEEQSLTVLLERNADSRNRVSEQIAQMETDDGKLQLAARTKLLLDKYQKRLTQHKLHQVETQLAKRFNQLCRKRNFIDRVAIDPRSFSVALYQDDHPISRRQLSAGEQQLFAIATLWALREVSGRPLPVIIDTPLSRLDSEHRQSLIDNFFPQVAHQIIILATDAEIDDKSLAYLQPVIARTYPLTEQVVGGLTQGQVQPLPVQASLIPLKEITLHVVE